MYYTSSTYTSQPATSLSQDSYVRTTCTHVGS